MILGVSWGGQFVSAIISFAFGIAGGVPAMLFFRKSSFLEQILTDFFACVVLLALYVLSVEVGSKGQLSVYSGVAFLCGIAVLTAIFKKIKGLFFVARRKSGQK